MGDLLILTYFGAKSQGKDDSGMTLWKPFRISQPILHFRRAVNRLRAIDNRLFDRGLAEKEGIPLYFASCSLQDDKGRILMLKSFMDGAHEKQAKPGIYLRIHKLEMPAPIIEIILKTKLPPVTMKGAQFDDHLMVSREDLWAFNKRRKVALAGKREDSQENQLPAKRCKR